MKKEKDDKEIKFIDAQSTEKMIEKLHGEISKAIKNIKVLNPQITKAVDLIAKTMLNGGKLYVYGCTSPARHAIVENLELQSLFSLNPELIQTSILGGDRALKDIKSEPKDSENTGRAEIVLSFVKDTDVLIILNSNENQNYTKGALTVAEQKNIPTVLISQNGQTSEYADINIALPYKSKKIATIQETYISTVYKTVLNMIFTGVMIKIGKVYENNIVDPNVERNKKQAVNIVMKYAKVDEDTAIQTLDKCKYHAKAAIVMLNKNVDLKTAITQLKKQKNKINDFVK